MENSNKVENKSSYKFSPEVSGMRDKFYPVYSIAFFAIVVCFIQKILFHFKSDFSIFGLSIYNIPSSYFKYFSIFLLVIALFKYIKLKLYIKSTKYILTPQRLTVERGILSKSISNLELWRVTDIQIVQTVAQKSFGACSIQMITSDISDPLLLISGLPYEKGRELYNILSEYINDAIKNGSIMRTI